MERPAPASAPADGYMPLPFCPYCGISHHELIRTHILNYAPAGTSFTEQEVYDAFLAMHPCYQGSNDTYDQVGALGRFEDLAEQYTQAMETAELWEQYKLLGPDEEDIAAVMVEEDFAGILGGDDAAVDHGSDEYVDFAEDQEQEAGQEGEKSGQTANKNATQKERFDSAPLNSPPFLGCLLNDGKMFAED